jgi:predicted nuclease with TOPRIM domain
MKNEELVNENESLRSEIERISKGFEALQNKHANVLEERNKFLNETYELKSKKDEISSILRAQISMNIARLKGVQMLFNVMKGGSTHRQKEIFAFQSVEAINVEISNILNDFQNVKYILGDDNSLPF